MRERGGGGDTGPLRGPGLWAQRARADSDRPGPTARPPSAGIGPQPGGRASESVPPARWRRGDSEATRIGLERLGQRYGPGPSSAPRRSESIRVDPSRSESIRSIRVSEWIQVNPSRWVSSSSSESVRGSESVGRFEADSRFLNY